MTDTIKKLDFATVSAMPATARNALFAADGLETASSNFASHADAVLWNMVLAFVTDPDEGAMGFARFITALNAAKSRKSKARNEFNKGKAPSDKRGATASEQAFGSIVKRFNDYMNWGLGYMVEKGTLHGGDAGPTHLRMPGFNTLGAIANDTATLAKVREMGTWEMNVPYLDLANVLAKNTVLDAGYAKPKLAPLESKIAKVYLEIRKEGDKRSQVAIDEAIQSYNDEVRAVADGTNNVSKDSSITAGSSAIDAMRDALARMNAPKPKADTDPELSDNDTDTDTVSETGDDDAEVYGPPAPMVANG